MQKDCRTTHPLASLQFCEGVLADFSNDDGKFLGRWNELAWAPLILVGSAISELISESIKGMDFNAVVQRRPPYIRPDKQEIEVGDDIVLILTESLPEECENRLLAVVSMFCLLIRNEADDISHGLDFSGLLQESDRVRAAIHADKFLKTHNGKTILEAFVCIAGKDRVLFAGHFNKLSVEPVSLSSPIEKIAKIEGAERRKDRASCTLELSEEKRQKAVFNADAELLSKVREAIWTDKLYAVKICLRGSGRGSEVWELIDVKRHVSAETQLF